jgi:hypothetical protein
VASATFVEECLVCKKARAHRKCGALALWLEPEFHSPKKRGKKPQIDSGLTGQVLSVTQWIVVEVGGEVTKLL